jgi:spore coat polysaccharide biosynthesis predicted glycosyltransferase SpsG/GTP:adenosylcobinamide-phosphate guanylyltransferase
MTNTWYMVPVRGGSVGVPRKNAKILGDKPLLCHVLATIKQIDPATQIVVVTDDDELKAIAEMEGVNVFMEPKTTGKATLDDVCMKALPFLEELGAKDKDIFLTIQATCPFVEKDTIEKAKEELSTKGGAVITMMDDRHLNWTIDNKGEPQPLYTARVNRQQLPPNFRESGAVIGSIIGKIKESKTRINEPINIIEISQKEGLDIDEYRDWVVAEYYANTKKIIFRADASKEIGMGHVYRTIMMVHELAKFSPTIATIKRDGDNLGEEFFRQFPYQLEVFESDKEFDQYIEKEKPDYLFLDQLSTTPKYIESLQENAEKIISFEDLGEGAKLSDLVVNDLYKLYNVDEDKQLYGVQNSFLPSSFLSAGPKAGSSKKVKTILLLFGGSDPLNLTTRTLTVLQNMKFSGEVVVVKGLGQKDRQYHLSDYGLEGEILENVNNIAQIMKRADLAISSAGRTVTELMYLGIPTMVVCQNERELTHSHASQSFGVHNIGLGSLVSDETIRNNIEFLIQNNNFRAKMFERSTANMRGHSNKAVLKRIFAKLGDDITF